MTEERVTKSIMVWLQENNWEIICYDFPQSGTGKCLRPDIEGESKNQDVIIPDIVAHKNKSVVFFENKTNYTQGDVDKLHNIKTTGSHSKSLSNLLADVDYDTIYYGVGLYHSTKNIEKGLANRESVDFFVSVNDARKIIINHDPYKVFL